MNLLWQRCNAWRIASQRLNSFFFQILKKSQELPLKPKNYMNFKCIIN